MYLRRSMFLVVFPLCHIFLYVLPLCLVSEVKSTYLQNPLYADEDPKDAESTKPRYSQEEIDNAWKRMIKREVYLKKWYNQTGCWPNNLVPFFISPGFTQQQIDHIFNHILQIQNETCVRWVEKRTLARRLTKMVVFARHPEDPEACTTSEYGKFPDGLYTRIFLGDRCFEDQSVIHEMMHALGLLHEHQRIDRDCYVEVHPSTYSNPQYHIIYDDLMFERWPYDKRSIVHYTRYWFKIKDKEEGFWDLPWDYYLGDQYGLFRKSYGKLTSMDVQKLNYRFCKGPDYCDIHPLRCNEIEEQEKKSGCKQIYEDIANGVVTPTEKGSS